MSYCYCRDCNGQVLQEGDYVVGVCGLPLSEGQEGYVSNIREYEYGFFIDLRTAGGTIIAINGHPGLYERRDLILETEHSSTK